MPVTVIVGAQWGDEGKGKVVDYLAERADMVIRFQGGPNAGHTIINDFGKFKLHGVPSGIFRSNVRNVVGAGSVVLPDNFWEEIEGVRSRNGFNGELYLSDRAHVIMPYHQRQEVWEEQSLGEKRVGTTGKGIGPAYSDKYGRWGIRLGDLAHPKWLKERLEMILKLKNAYLAQWGEPPMDLDVLMEQCRRWQDRLGQYICNTAPLVTTALTQGEHLLLEGQLGAGRDVDWGCYPFVTSSSPTAGAVCCGAGIPPRCIAQVIGVVKAYSTAVGAGPMVVRDEDGIGPELRRLGQEFGATTGRPRDCGWLDLVMLRHSAMINGFTSVAVTRLDILDTIETIGICTAYRYKGKILTEMPITPVLQDCEPVVEYLPGWKCSTRNISKWKNLPPQAKTYLNRIKETVRAPVAFVSVGPRREETILRDEPMVV